MSSWLPSFGGKGQSKEEKQAEEAKAWREGTLGTGDEFFTHSRQPDQDNGTFKLTDVRQRPKQADRGGSRLVRLPKGAYEQPPELARGLKSLDLNHKSKDHFQKQAIDITSRVFADDSKIISPLIQAWLSDEKTQLIYDAELTWLEAKTDAKESLFLNGTFDLSKGEKEKSVKFPKPFPKDVEVEVHGWVSGFRFSTESEEDFGLDFYPSKVSNKGFTAHADCSSNAERLDVTWIVHKKGKRKLATGSFSSEDAEGRKENAPEASGKVQFEEGTFEKAPTVLAALSQFDLAGGRDLRVGVEISDVSKDGFTWKLSTWGDSSKDALHTAEATFFALGYV